MVRHHVHTTIVLRIHVADGFARKGISHSPGNPILAQFSSTHVHTSVYNASIERVTTCHQRLAKYHRENNSPNEETP